MAPQLQNLQQQNAELQRRLAKEARARLDSQVERAVPNYREIDQDPAWHRWLASADPLTGRARQHHLNDAIASTDVNRVKAFFNGFEREHGQQQVQQAPRSQPRSQRMSLWDRNAQPTYTRAQIKQNYEAHRRGAYEGREAEWNRLEWDMCRASGEGRVAGAVDLQGK